ncbi:MAG: ABC transporter ATP-binding protein [Phycisphaerae bacterium]|nr:ABC transporter ATP-binding protein [Phycisphaerae bacterium]
MSDRSEQSGDPVIRTEKLTKSYGDVVALDSLDLELPAGRILGYIGPNGAGKTTTIRILVGLARPTSGRAWVAGHDCTRDVRRIKRLVGYMPDVFGGYDNMRVREYLDFFGAAFRIPRRQRIGRIGEVMEIAGCTHMQDLFVEALSHGMKQRVGIARTLLHDPPVLILDEPANGLDPAARIDMRRILRQLADMGKTLIVTSHILPELARVCDLVGIIIGGRLRALGTLEQIMRQVRQRRLIEVTLTRHEQVQPLVELLRGQLEEEAEITASEHEAEVRFSTTAGDDQLTALLTLAVHQNLQVAGYQEVPLDLEDAYLEFTAQAEKGGEGE